MTAPEPTAPEPTAPEPTAPEPTAPEPTAPSLRRTLLLFTGLRVVLFAGAFAVALVFGVPTPLALVAGLGVSAIASFLLMGPQRDQIAAGLQSRGQRKAGDRARRREALDAPDS